jgi:hypothetical protein
LRRCHHSAAVKRQSISEAAHKTHLFDLPGQVKLPWHFFLPEVFSVIQRVRA